MTDLKALPWFPDAVREIRTFRMENNSDFTDFAKK
jgi:virulence-associated protein VapD